MVVGEVKHNGIRALWLRDHHGTPNLYTREGYEIPGVDHIKHELAAWERHAGERMFLDGEFVIDSADSLAATEAWCDKGHKLGGTAGVFYVFDGFAYNDWFRGGTDVIWLERKARLERLAKAVASDEPHRWDWRPGSRGAECGIDPVTVVPHQELWTVDCVVEMTFAMWNAGLEGIVLKNAEAGYQRSRNSAWRKVGRLFQAKMGWRPLA